MAETEPSASVGERRRDTIEQVLFAMDQAFSDNPFHALTKNLANVREDDWEWLPSDGQRTIRHIVEHVGYAKRMYADHAFGTQAMSWEDRSVLPQQPSPDVMISWLHESHALFRGGVASLDSDEELAKMRRAPWGMDVETRWLIVNMIQHDLYHAGEINHLRALHQRNDE